MAVWQFDAMAIGPDGDTSLPAHLRVSAEAFLAGIVQPNTESNKWTMYRTDGDNQINLLHDSDGCEIEVRVDARSDADTFLCLVCLLMASLGCTLYLPESDERIPAEVGALKAALMQSTSWQYALQQGAAPS